VQAADEEATLQEVGNYFKAGRRAGASRPGVLIPRSTLFFADGAFLAGAAGTYGTVVPAQQDLMTQVAVKLYNYGQLGNKDMRLALREALMLKRLSHTNVVRCLGIVDDPDTESSKSIHGSLVMNWVDGGQLYTWLQNRDEDEDGEPLPLAVRLGVVLQVAAGMNHLHVCKVMHGDLKPQNVLLRQRPLALTECPRVSHSACTAHWGMYKLRLQQCLERFCQQTSGRGRVPGSGMQVDGGCRAMPCAAM
jgi:serine/threonine protein kinase